MTLAQHLRFTLSLQHHLFPDGDRNSCWSPLSVASCLGLLAEGAVSTTRRELVAVLMGDAGTDGIVVDEHASFLAQATTLSAPPGRRITSFDPPELAVSNTLWIDQSVHVDTAYVDEVLGIWPNGTVRAAPFATAPDDARQQINAAVAKQTHDLIPHLLRAGSITPDTLAALANALYLRAGWATPFRRRATQAAKFTTPAGQTEVDMMSGTAGMGYAHTEGWEVVNIPALGGVCATVLLPNAPLADAETRLDAPQLTRLLDDLMPHRVQLLLPRLAVSARSALVPTLQGLGVEQLFTDEAQLDALVRVGSGPLTVSQIAHEAVLRVDEDGLEGAAATAAVVSRGIGSQEAPMTVVVDRPFLLLIRHRSSGVVYFLARVTSP